MVLITGDVILDFVPTRKISIISCPGKVIQVDTKAFTGTRDTRNGVAKYDLTANVAI